MPIILGGLDGKIYFVSAEGQNYSNWAEWKKYYFESAGCAKYYVWATLFWVEKVIMGKRNFFGVLSWKNYFGWWAKLIWAGKTILGWLRKQIILGVLSWKKLFWVDWVGENISCRQNYSGCTKLFRVERVGKIISFAQNYFGLSGWANLFWVS